MRKKRVQLTVDADKWEEVQDYLKSAELPQDFISSLLRDVIDGILPVMRQAKEDADKQKEMKKKEMEKRYRELAEKSFSKL